MTIAEHRLIQPVKSGEKLLDEIASTRPEPRTMAIWWLGQSGFVLKTRFGLMVIDPYLSESLTTKYANTDRPHIRMTEAPFRGGDLGGASLILASHKHSDHMDPGTLPDLLRASPDATLIAPCSHVDHLLAMGVEHERTIALDVGDVHAQSGFLIRAVPAAHEELSVDDGGRHLFLGFVVEAEGIRLYHSGDSIFFGTLPGWLGADPYDILFLPINGRDPKRGVPGNMTAAEAVELATEIRPRFVVPHHYDMFTFNTVPVAEFEGASRELPPEVEAKILRCGERWIVKARETA